MISKINGFFVHSLCLVLLVGIMVGNLPNVAVGQKAKPGTTKQKGVVTPGTPSKAKPRAKSGYRKPPSRRRNYRGVVVVRPHGHAYHGYGYHYNDNDAFKWLAFTAITLKILDNINEEQQRKHETAQIQATSASIGDSITWEEGNAYGSVTATKEGKDASGKYCREFQQEITVGGETEKAYGTACLQPDGDWEIVETSP